MENPAQAKLVGQKEVASWYATHILTTIHYDVQVNEAYGEKLQIAAHKSLNADVVVHSA